MSMYWWWVVGGGWWAVGGGAAALRAAIEAQRAGARVAIAVKGRLGVLFRGKPAFGLSAALAAALRQTDCQANPWVGYDHRLTVEVSRAMGLGAQFVLVSNSCKQETDECVEVVKGGHRKAMIIHPFNDENDWLVKRDKPQDSFVIPQPESKKAIEEIDEVIKHPDVKAVFFAMSDATMSLTGQKNRIGITQRSGNISTGSLRWANNTTA